MDEKKPDVGILEGIIQEGLAQLAEFGQAVQSHAVEAQAVANRVLTEAEKKIKVLKAISGDLATGRIFQAERIIVEEINFQDSLTQLDFLRNLELVFNWGALNLRLHPRSNADKSIPLDGKYRIIVIFQRVGTPPPQEPPK